MQPLPVLIKNICLDKHVLSSLFSFIEIEAMACSKRNLLDCLCWVIYPREVVNLYVVFNKYPYIGVMQNIKVMLSFKTRPRNLDNAGPFCVWLLDYFHACLPRKCICVVNILCDNVMQIQKI